VSTRARSLDSLAPFVERAAAVTLLPEARDATAGASALIAALDATVARARGSALYHERLRDVRIRSLDDLQRVALTTREDLQRAGVHGTRAVPLADVCHYGESSGTSGATNAMWLTANDLVRNADAFRATHPDVFAPGRMLLNRFPFMAAPAQLIQLVAQRGGGVSIPAGNINWDVPFGRALELARTTGVQVLASLPLEPVVLEAMARERGLDPARDFAFDTFFLGGSSLPPAMRRRMARIWGARVIELYGSTETMLLGTSCGEGGVHLETGLVHCEVLRLDRSGPVDVGEEGLLVVTTLGIEGSPLVRLDTGDLVRRLGPCACGDPRPSLVVLGRERETLAVGGTRLHHHTLVDAAAEAADALDSSVFFAVVLPDRVVVRVETRAQGGVDPSARLGARLGGVPVEIEPVEPGMLLDTELLGRSPHVYKPVVVADWRGAGRRILTVGEGMIEWPRPTPAELWRWAKRVLSNERRRRALGRRARVVGHGGR